MILKWFNQNKWNWIYLCTEFEICVRQRSKSDFSAACMPLLLSLDPQSGNAVFLRWEIVLWLLRVVLNVNVSKPGMISTSTSQADLPWGHRAERCFNYPWFLLSHCHREAPGATLPCGAESPRRGGDDNSDNGSARSTDATRVPSEICLSDFPSVCSLLCQRVFMKKAIACMKGRISMRVKYSVTRSHIHFSMILQFVNDCPS